MKNNKKILEYGILRLKNSPLKVNKPSYCKECGASLSSDKCSTCGTGERVENAS